MPVVAADRSKHQGPDVGAAGAGAVAEHPAPRDTGLGQTSVSNEQQGNCYPGERFSQSSQKTKAVGGRLHAGAFEENWISAWRTGTATFSTANSEEIP